LRRLVAILNPTADRGRTARLAESLRDALGARFELRLLQTTARGEAVKLAHDAASAGCDAVIAIGGDGTVHEVMNGLMRVTPAAQRPAMGILPAGSGNDVAYALGITKNLAEAAATIERGATRAVDIGNVQAVGGPSCHCINNIGTLLEGEINRESHRLTWPRGSGLYLRALMHTLLRPLPVDHVSLTFDGQTSSRVATILSIANGPRSGGKFQLMPDAQIDDGRFDYLLAGPISRLRLLWNVRHALAGRRLGGDWIERGRFSRLTLQADKPLVVHIDGEPWLALEDGVQQLRVHVMPKALAVLSPTS
jgi:diacylglycerol kinase (ATP)